VTSMTPLWRHTWCHATSLVKFFDAMEVSLGCHDAAVVLPH
jgi:hypothetical protein